MFFAKSLLATLAAASTAAATITIGVPSASSYWVQFSQNTISWTFDSGDPNPINIYVVNSNSSILNGNFSIANAVDLSNGTFTVTNVTLTVGDGYKVQFVNTSDSTQVFASSGAFQVMPNGTAAASTSTGSAASASATSASGSGASGSSTASGSSSSSTSAALRNLAGSFDSALPIVISAGMAVAGGFLAF